MLAGQKLACNNVAASIHGSVSHYSGIVFCLATGGSVATQVAILGLRVVPARSSSLPCFFWPFCQTINCSVVFGKTCMNMIVTIGRAACLDTRQPAHAPWIGRCRLVSLSLCAPLASSLLSEREVHSRCHKLGYTIIDLGSVVSRQLVPLSH